MGSFLADLSQRQESWNVVLLPCNPQEQQAGIVSAFLQRQLLTDRSVSSVCWSDLMWTSQMLQPQMIPQHLQRLCACSRSFLCCASPAGFLCAKLLGLNTNCNFSAQYAHRRVVLRFAFSFRGTGLWRLYINGGSSSISWRWPVSAY